MENNNCVAILRTFTNENEILIMDEVTDELTLRNLSDQYEFYR